MKNFNIIVILLLILLSHSAHSLETLTKQENKYSLTTVKQLKDSVYSSKIDSLFLSVELQKFKGKKDIDIAYKVFLQDSTENGAIVISSGRTESMVKYSEVIYDLYNNGFSVYILDHRGQGFSGRMTKDPEMGYVSDFQYYIDDLKTFYNATVAKNSHTKRFLLAHSMGGAISVSYVQHFPNDFNKVSLSSPMLGLPFPIEVFIGFLYNEKEIKYAIGNKGYKESIKSFKDNSLTNSKERYNIFMETNKRYPETVLGGTTYHWVYNSCKQFDYIFDNISKLQTPIILFSGTEETIVAPTAHKEFVKEAQKLKKDVTGYSVVNSKHECFIEKDNVRIDVLTTTIDFFLE